MMMLFVCGILSVVLYMITESAVVAATGALLALAIEWAMQKLIDDYCTWGGD